MEDERWLWGVLPVLAALHHAGSLRADEFTHLVGSSPTTARKARERLQQLGLVVVETAKARREGKRIMLTPTGRAVARQAAAFLSVLHTSTPRRRNHR